MDDSIFHEVAEDLRHEKFVKLWKDFGIYIILGIVAIIVGTAATLYWRHHVYEQRATESREFTTAIQTAEKGSLDQALSQLKNLAATGGSYAGLAELQRAGLIIQANKDKKPDAPDLQEAIKIYNDLSKNRKVDTKIRNLALVLSVLAQIDTGDPQMLKDQLAQATTLSNPWTALAKEAAALLAKRTGDHVQAKALLNDLKEDPRTPPSVKERANALLLRF